MGTDKEDQLLVEEKMRKGKFKNQFPKRRDFFTLFSFEEAKLKFKTLLENNKSINEKDTIIEMDWDMEKPLNANGYEIGVFHQNGDEIKIIKIDPLKGCLPIRKFRLKKLSSTEFILHDVDYAKTLYSDYYFIAKKLKKKPN